MKSTGARGGKESFGDYLPAFVCLQEKGKVGLYGQPSSIGIQIKIHQLIVTPKDTRKKGRSPSPENEAEEKVKIMISVSPSKNSTIPSS